MTAERKYTDRDVREDPTLRQIAEDYIVDYGGDFEPLVNAVHMMEEGYELPTNVIRVILNCMRHDYTVAGELPPPQAVVLKLVKDVPKKNVTKKKSDQCGASVSHESHIWYEDEFAWTGRHRCPGVPFAINREPFILDAKIKRPYVVARSGNFIHMTSGEGWIAWNPPRHEYGWGWPDPELAVDLLCRFPSVVRSGTLLTSDEAEKLVTMSNLIKPISICPHCLKEKKRSEPDPD